MVTLKQIAAAAGVTEASVSMAMRNSRSISKARREQIQELAAAMGYRRNAHVSTLMRHIRNGRLLSDRATLALLLAIPEANARQLGIVERTCSGAEQRAVELGYRTDFFWYNDPKVTPRQLNHILVSRGIQGVIVVAFRSTTVHLDWNRFALAATNYTIPDPPLHRVHGDIFVNTKIAMEKLWERGYRRIGLAGPELTPSGSRSLIHFYAHSAYLGFLAERLRHRLGKIPPPFEHADSDWTDGPEAFLKWYDRHKPEAVITTNWHMAEWLRGHGVRVPEDTAVVLTNYGSSAGNYAGIDPHPDIIGRTAAEMVIEQLENNEFGVPAYPKIVTIEGQWIEGGTIHPLKRTQ